MVTIYVGDDSNDEFEAIQAVTPHILKDLGVNQSGDVDKDMKQL